MAKKVQTNIVVTTKEIQTWFKKAAPQSWPTPPEEQLTRIVDFLEGRLYGLFTPSLLDTHGTESAGHEDGVEVETFLSEVAKISNISAIHASAKNTIKAVKTILDPATSLLKQLEIGKSEPDFCRAAIYYLNAIIDLAMMNMPSKRSTKSYLVNLVFELVRDAWVNAGHQARLGRGIGSPAFNVVQEIFMRMNVEFKDKTLRDALANWPDPFPTSGSDLDGLTRDFDYHFPSGRRIYASEVLKASNEGRFVDVSDVPFPLASWSQMIFSVAEIEKVKKSKANRKKKAATRPKIKK